MEDLGNETARTDTVLMPTWGKLPSQGAQSTRDQPPQGCKKQAEVIVVHTH